MNSKEKKDFYLNYLKNNGVEDEDMRKELLSIIMENNNDLESYFMKGNGNLGKAQKISLKFVNKSPNASPIYAKEGDSGFDLRAWIEEGSITLHSLERRLISTGIYIELPQGYEAQIRPRSGCALKQGLGMVNSPGTIDAHYRGECKLIMINLSGETITINNGDRIAQMVICPVASENIISLVEVDEIDECTARGSSGFGSSGVK